MAEKCEEVGLLGRGLKLKKTEMVGHSLGAHIAGLTAEKLSQKTNQKIGVIFGLDPAGPIIKNLPKELRLNETQAEFVVVYHTSRLGIQKKIGHGKSINHTIILTIKKYKFIVEYFFSS